MTILAGIGFETRDSGECQATAGTVNFNYTTIKHSGNCAARINPVAGTGYLRVNGRPTSGIATDFGLTTGYFGVWIYFDTIPSGNFQCLQIMNSAANSMVEILYASASGNFLFRYYNVSDVATNITTTTAVAADTPYYIEIGVVNAGTAGSASVECRINGAVYGTASSLTLRSGTRTLDRIHIGSATSHTGDVVVDDIYCDDAAFLGEVGIEALFPDSAGNVADWTGGSGSTFAAVDDWATGAHDTDTSYIKATTAVGSNFNCGATSSAIASGTLIHAIKSVGYLRDEGGASSFAVRVRDVTTQSITTSGDPGATYVMRGRYYPTGVVSGVAWTKAEADALMVGVDNNAAVAARCTALALHVIYQIPSVTKIPVFMHNYRRWRVP